MNKMFRAVRFKRVATGVAVAAPVLPALAVVDTTPITDAGADGLLYAAAVAGVLIAIWGAKLAYRKFFGG